MKKIVIIVAIIFGGSGLLSAQDEAPAHRYLGIGFRLNTFTVSELNMNYPMNRLVLNVDPHKYLRADFQYGYYSYKNSVLISIPSGYTNGTLDDKSSMYMLGVLGQYRFDDMYVYGGIRFGKSKETYEDYYVDSPFPYTSYSITYYESTMEYDIIAPVIGGEYRFGNRFSVGAEISFLRMKSTFKYGNPNNSAPNPGTDEISMPETAAFFRFYPF